MSINDERISQDIAKFNIADATIAQIAEQTNALTIASLDDKAGFEVVKRARLDVAKLRTKVENVRKELKADSLEYGRRIDAEAKRLTELILAIELPLKKKEDWFTSENDRIKREAEEAERRAKWEAEQAERIAAQKAEDERLAKERAKLAEEQAELIRKQNELAKAETERLAREAPLVQVESKPTDETPQQFRGDVMFPKPDIDFGSKLTPCQAHAVEPQPTTKQEESALCVQNVMDNEYDGMELVDLLVDIMHFCNKQGLDAQQEWDDATRLYEQEK